MLDLNSYHYLKFIYKILPLINMLGIAILCFSFVFKIDLFQKSLKDQSKPTLSMLQSSSAGLPAISTIPRVLSYPYDI